MFDRLRRPAILLCPALLVMAATVGCEDATSRQRADNQKIIAKASEDLAMISFASGEKGLQKLAEIERDLANVTGAEGGQQTAADLLKASISRELAGHAFLAAERLEADMRRERAAAHDLLNAAVQLDTLAAARERLARDDSRSFLADEREAAVSELDAYEARLAELDGPIAERVTANEADWQRAAELKAEASDLRRNAAEQGRRAGLPIYQRAIELEQQADAFEIEVARRENDLRYDLEPEHSLATAWADRYSGMLANIEEAEDALAARADASAALASQMRAELGELDQRLATRLGTISTIETQELAPVYDKITQQLGKAATSVARVARADDAGKMAATRVFAMQGQLHRNRALSASDQAVLLGRIVELDGAVGDATASRAALDAVQVTYEQAVQEAISAYEQAKDTLGGVRKQSPEVGIFQRELDRSLASLTGDAMPEEAPVMTGGPGAPPAGSGADSPDELIAMMHAAGTDPSMLDRLLANTYTETPQQLQAFTTMRRMMAAVRRLGDAARAQLGDEAADQITGGFSGMSEAFAGLQQASIVSEEDGRVVVSTPSRTDPSETTDLIEIDGRWWVDGRDVEEDLDPQSLAMMDQMATMFEEAVAELEAGNVEGFQQMLGEMMGQMMQEAMQETEEAEEPQPSAGPSMN